MHIYIYNVCVYIYVCIYVYMCVLFTCEYYFHVYIFTHLYYCRYFLQEKMYVRHWRVTKQETVYHSLGRRMTTRDTSNLICSMWPQCFYTVHLHINSMYIVPSKLMVTPPKALHINTITIFTM